MREVVARVAALLRRVERAAELADAGRRPALVVGDLVVDTGTRRRTVARTEEVHLTPTEFDLLACLAREPGQVLTRERLLADVWDWAEPASPARPAPSTATSRRCARKLGADADPHRARRRLRPRAGTAP